MTETTIKIPIYFGELVIIQAKNTKKVSLKYNIGVEGFDAVCVRNNYLDGYTQYVMIFIGKTTPEIIAHECVHFVNNLFEDRGIDLSIDNDEPQAYMMGWVVQQCHNVLKLK